MDVTNTVSIDEFKKIDLRVALVEDAERVQGTTKLMVLSLRVGGEKRKIVSGIADQYAPEEMKGKRIILFSNLQPRAVRGIESQGMLLAAVEQGGRLALLTTDREISDGTRVE